MSQLAYAPDFDVAFPGMPADGRPLDADSGYALESLDFGRAAFKVQVSGKPDTVRHPKRNQPVQVWSGDFVTSNVINGVVNGVAITPVNFDNDHLTTVTALADEIVAVLLAQGIVATYALTSSNRTITFTVTDANVLFANFVVTGGAGQVTVTLTHGTSDTLSTFKGLLRHSSQPPRSADGLPGYGAGDSVALVKKGTLWVPISSDVADGADVYVDMTAGNEGKLTDVTTSPNFQITSAKFRGAHTVAGLGIAKVEINLP